MSLCSQNTGTLEMPGNFVHAVHCVSRRTCKNILYINRKFLHQPKSGRGTLSRLESRAIVSQHLGKLLINPRNTRVLTIETPKKVSPTLGYPQYAPQL